MTERDLSLKLQKGLESQGIECYPFYDLAKGVEKPFDFCACCPGGLFWAVECKLVNVPSWESKACLLGPRSFRPKQLPNLMRVAAKGGRASVVLFVVPPRAIDTRAWLLSARGVAHRFQSGLVYRLEDFQAERTERYELVRIPGVGWGLRPDLLATFISREPQPTASFEQGWNPGLTPSP
jgi:hypothetical protein